MRRSHWTTLAASAISLLGLVSCADVTGDEAPGSPSDPPADTTTAAAKAPPYKPDEVLVRFKSGVAHTRSAAVHAQRSAQVLREYRVPSNLQLVKLPQGTDIAKVIDGYRSDPDVLFAEPNFIYQLAVVPDDPRLGDLWGMNNTGQLGGVVDADINAPEAWEITTGSSSVVIGLLDTGFDYNHPDLAVNIFSNPGEIPGNGIDDDGNGWVDDVHGIDTIGETGNPMDTDGHGTHVTGTMAARGNNTVGVAGVNWNASIVACKAFGPAGATLADILQCMDYFLALKTRPTNPVDIVATNNSWGGGPFSQALLDSITAFRNAGILFVAAAGNNGSNNDVTAFFPAVYDVDNIISVLATDRTDHRASFSNFGTLTVDVGAPGVDILSTLPGNTYGLLSGTSMATPHVTGLVGLLKAQNPMRTASQIKNLILTGGTPTPGTTGASISGRRIRADRSLSCVNLSLVNRLAPTATMLVVGVGTPVPLSMLSITCDAPTTAPQIVTIVETGATISLVDAGGTGQFSGTYTPSNIGTQTLAFPNGDMVSVSAVGNYDPATVVPFEFPVIAGTALPLICDDCSTPVTLPFPVRFAGASPGLTTVHVGSNGVLSFTAPITTFSNVALPAAGLTTVVAPFWDDLNPGAAGAGASVVTATLGNAPNRQFVIEYRNVPHFSNTGAATFQVIFFEGSPNIRFNYADVTFGSAAFDRGASATVGIQVTGGVARQFSLNTASLSDNLSLLWTMGAPIAAAGPDQFVLPGATVHLDGTSSRDLDGTIASFAWTQTAGPPVVLQGANTATPSFTAPTASGTMTFRLEVTDNEGKLGSDTVDVTVDQPPVAVPNPDFRIGTNLLGTLNATASHDPDGVIVGFHWKQIHGDPVTINNADTQIATFLSPPTAQFLVFQLTVVDEHGFTGTDVVVVDVFLNLVPVASAGQDRIVRPGASVTIDGTASHDPDGTIVSYAWTVPACFTTTGPCTITLAGASTATPQFVAPSTSAVVTLRLTVTDNAGAVATDTITIGVFLQAPSAVITAATACVQGGATVTLDATRSLDPDGEIVSYAWTQVSGPPVVLTGATSATASFAAPAAGTLVFSLTVTDNDGLVATRQVTIPVDPPPVARATASAPVVVAGTTVTLDGSLSTDAVSYSWRQTAGTAATISDPSAASPTFVAANPAAAFELVSFELTVTDACGARSTASVTIVVVRT
ncbi:MAG TPA: S8 family serine peptidase [Kofleriaceae bacterium]|nr:S8 family serine peptidase [Kofleriaceae bacterium]